MICEICGKSMARVIYEVVSVKPKQVREVWRDANGHQVTIEIPTPAARDRSGE
jgi:hypothetical protein